MADFPEPPVPAEADLRGHAWMALPINAIKGSRLWLRCRRQPELAYPFFNLVFASWNQIPAGSLPEDPEFLADISGISSRAWTRVRDVVLAEWTLHSDGRLYHSAIAKEAARAWEIQKSHRTKTLAATAKRMENYHNVKKDDTIDVTSISTRTTDTQTNRQTDKEKDSRHSAAALAQGMVDAWNTHSHTALAAVQKLTAPRLARLTKILHEDFHGDPNEWRQFVERVSRSDFLTGASGRGWRADLDWCIKPANLIKIVEGTYNNRADSQPPAGLKVVTF